MIALPFLVVISSGIFLLLKKEVAWIQPPTKKGLYKIPGISFDQLLHAAKRVPEAGVDGWEDIDRLDYRPDYGSVKVQCKNRWELQVDTHTGELLHAAYRRSDLIETIHDGSWFHENAKLLVFLPSAVIVLSMWLTGIYLFYLPYKVRWLRARNLATRKRDERETVLQPR